MRTHHATTYGCGGCDWEGTVVPSRCPVCGSSDFAVMGGRDVVVVTSEGSPLRVDWILPRLGMTILPGKSGLSANDGTTMHARDLDEDFRRLDEAGVQRLVNLVPDEEMRRFGVEPEAYLAQCARRGIGLIRFPFEDNTTPPDNDDFGELLHHLKVEVRTEARVVVHCRGGQGRAGVVVGCLLRELGYSGAFALHLLERRYPQFCPYTEGQRTMVRTWDEVRR